MPNAMDEVFGFMPERPNTPDFWRLSEIVLQLDASTQGPDTEDRKQAGWDAAVAAAGIDGEAISYVGLQRAFRIAGVTTQAHLFDPKVRETAMKIAAAYMEATLVGIQFERRRAPQR